MKVEQLLVQYLYKNKHVQIQDIGSFTISPDVVLPADGDKDTSLPEGAVQFEFDKKAPADENLINYIVEQSGKIRSLAASDLESYTILTRQFLNIGKPLHIDGLGVLQKNQQGTLDFTQGSNITSRAEVPHAVMKEKLQEEISFATPSKKKPSNKGWMLAVLLLFILCTGAAVYYFLTREKEQPVAQVPVEMNNDSTAGDTSATAGKDSLGKPANVATNPQPAADGYSFKIVIKEYATRAAAQKAYDKLTSYGHQLLIKTTDSSHYKISMPFTTPVTDTLRAKDSLRRFFGGNPYVEL
jgi:hypothetical protein